MKRLELHYRAMEGDLAGIAERIAAGDDVRAADSNGWTPLHFAAHYQRAQAVRDLLAAGADVDPRDRHGATPLFRAVMRSEGDGETIGVLLAAGSDPDVTNVAGRSPRIMAHTIANHDLRRFFPDEP